MTDLHTDYDGKVTVSLLHSHYNKDHLIGVKAEMQTLGRRRFAR